MSVIRLFLFAASVASAPLAPPHNSVSIIPPTTQVQPTIAPTVSAADTTCRPATDIVLVDDMSTSMLHSAHLAPKREGLDAFVQSVPACSAGGILVTVVGADPTRRTVELRIDARPAHSRLPVRVSDTAHNPFAAKQAQRAQHVADSLALVAAATYDRTSAAERAAFINEAIAIHNQVFERANGSRVCQALRDAVEFFNRPKPAGAPRAMRILILNTDLLATDVGTGCPSARIADMVLTLADRPRHSVNVIPEPARVFSLKDVSLLF
ncbi:MAG TPA: hypothetical protein VN706_12410 [Gemmatimonadaceae bacterium]|nr:hypothetical protein [Gemmatimonadaceae bacterium]